MVLKNKKNLGQHWLRNREILTQIVDQAELTKDDTVLEIGPGLGTLTSVILRSAKSVVAVEFDEELARKLPAQFPGKDLKVINQDILSFNLNELPADYKVVANVPYYITSKIIQLLMTAKNKPKTVVLLIQKEVADRVVAKPGDLSILALSVQIYAKAKAGLIVPKEYFIPPPKVDSQVIILETRTTPLVDGDDEKLFFKLVKAGFSAKRKKLKTSLSGGLQIEKEQALGLLAQAGIDNNLRAEDLAMEDWKKLLNGYRELIS